MNRVERLVGPRAPVRPELVMTLPRTVADVLADHVVFEVECIDRMYLNVYVPQLQYAAGLVGYVHRQLGLPVASTAPLAAITDAFAATMRRFAREGCAARCRGDPSTSPLAARVFPIWTASVEQRRRWIGLLRSASGHLRAERSVSGLLVPLSAVDGPVDVAAHPAFHPGVHEPVDGHPLVHVKRQPVADSGDPHPEFEVSVDEFGDHHCGPVDCIGAVTAGVLHDAEDQVVDVVSGLLAFQCVDVVCPRDMVDG